MLKVKTKANKQLIIDENKEIHRGGEGKIILIDKNHVAKIYLPGIKPITEEKFNFLTKLDKNLFVAPEELLYDKVGVVGFTMQYLGQDFYPLSTIFGKNFCASNKIDAKIKFKIASSLVKAVEYAHSNNVVIGDLNGFNVLINKHGDIKLIDVDSYEVPGCSHSGILLDEIRDYLFAGKVHKGSDYFALSVLIFNFMTYVHPFKGIHKKLKTLGERMIAKVPVFVKDPDLIVPKCYEPLADSFVQEQFNKLYIKGERFILSLDKAVATVTLPKPQPKVYNQNELNITNILVDMPIRKVFFMNSQGLVETDEHFYVYDSKNHGYLLKKHIIPKDTWEEMFIGNSNIIAKRNKKLYYYNSLAQFEEITNFDIPEDALFYQLGSILMIIGEGDMFWLYLDEITQGLINCKRTQVFSKGFKGHKGLVQNAGGVQYVFYNTGKDIATVKSDINILSLYQYSNFGFVTYIEQNRTKTKFFRIENMKMILSDRNIESPEGFAYKPADSKHGFIFSSIDGGIQILRTQDFQEVSTIKCDLISSSTSIQNSDAGLIAWEGENCWLLNKK